MKNAINFKFDIFSIHENIKVSDSQPSWCFRTISWYNDLLLKKLDVYMKFAAVLKVCDINVHINTAHNAKVKTLAFLMNLSYEEKGHFCTVVPGIFACSIDPPLSSRTPWDRDYFRVPSTSSGAQHAVCSCVCFFNQFWSPAHSLFLCVLLQPVPEPSTQSVPMRACFFDKFWSLARSCSCARFTCLFFLSLPSVPLHLLLFFAMHTVCAPSSLDSRQNSRKCLRRLLGHVSEIYSINWTFYTRTQKENPKKCCKVEVWNEIDLSLKWYT